MGQLLVPLLSAAGVGLEGAVGIEDGFSELGLPFLPLLGVFVKLAEPAMVLGARVVVHPPLVGEAVGLLCDEVGPEHALALLLVVLL